MARTPALFIDGKFKSPAADQRAKTPSCKGLVAVHRQADREPCLRFCAILSAKISLLPPRIARNGLISETGSLLTAPSPGESMRTWLPLPAASSSSLARDHDVKRSGSDESIETLCWAGGGPACRSAAGLFLPWSWRMETPPEFRGAFRRSDGYVRPAD